MHPIFPTVHTCTCCHAVESHCSNYAKPSALLLFLLENHCKRPSLIAIYQYAPLFSMPHPSVKKRVFVAETDAAQYKQDHTKVRMLE